LDAAVMRFIGVRRRVVFLALLLEAALIALAGSAVGVGLALLGGALTNAYYRRLFDTALIFSLVTPRIVLFSVALSLGLGLGAGALAAWRLVSTSPTALWGRGDAAGRRVSQSAPSPASNRAVGRGHCHRFGDAARHGHAERGIERSFERMLLSRGYQIRLSRREPCRSTPRRP